MVGQLVASLPQTIKDEQALENPYSSDNSLHATFAEGWYSGYIAGQLFVMWVGGEVVKSIMSSEQFARISDSAFSKLHFLLDPPNLFKVSYLNSSLMARRLLYNPAGSIAFEVSDE